MLVGNGRGDVSHYDFQAARRGGPDRVRRDAADGTVGRRSSKQAALRRRRLREGRPGQPARRPGRGPQGDRRGRAARPLPGHPAGARSNRVTEGLGEHDLAKGSRVVYEKPFGTSPEGFEQARQARAQGARRGPGLSASTTSWERRRRRTCTSCASPTVLFDAVWCRDQVRAVQIDVPEKLGHRRPRRSSTTPPAPCSTCSSPTCSRSRPRSRWSRRRASAPTTCRRPARRSSAASARSTRRKSSSASSTASPTSEGIAKNVEDRHLRRGPAVGRQRPLARRAVPAAHRQAAARQLPAGQPDPARSPTDGRCRDPAGRQRRCPSTSAATASHQR